jgi:hypothetical protein
VKSTILLISTMLQLSLNLASTRLILSRGHEGTAAPGPVRLDPDADRTRRPLPWHHRRHRRTIGFFVLIPSFGVIGAVAATTVSFVAMALMLRNSAKTIAGIDGSVLRLMTRFRGTRVAAPAE